LLPNDGGRVIGSRPSRREAGLPERGLVLCAFTQTVKINPPMFDIWMRVLGARPDAVLWLRDPAPVVRAHLRREAASRDIDPERLIFAERLRDPAAHLGRQSLADLYLDTLPYNAHSTTCDALWAGVPVLTCMGKTFASRLAASALRAVGLPELVTGNLAEYESLALELTGDPPRLAALRSRLAEQRLQAPLFDTTRYTRQLEDAFIQLYDRAAAGLGPAGFASESPGAG
jgi:predicted O-linked N-acetylglucosamine transferase (SPINDLY family)